MNNLPTISDPGFGDVHTTAPVLTLGLNQGQKDITAGDGTPPYFCVHYKATWRLIILSPDNVKYYTQ